jgi:glucosamine-6-phosphate deaminase
VEVLILPDPAAVAVAAADRLTAAVAAKPDLVLALPTGRTPLPLYDELAARYQRGQIDLSQVGFFHLDELALTPDHPASFATYRDQHAGARVGLDPTKGDIPRGDAPDLEAESRRYDAAIAAAGGLDLAVLGIGEDGHVAYNLPGPVREETHVVRLPDSLAAQLGVASPLSAITLGLRAMREARQVVILATGASKRRAVRALVEGPEDLLWPASLLRGHPKLTVILDVAAGRTGP